MRLAEFIKANIESISAEWERFAATLLPAEEFSSSVLRDDIAEILDEIATDMDRDQSSHEQQTKSQGNRADLWRRGIEAACLGEGANGIFVAATHL